MLFAQLWETIGHKSVWAASLAIAFFTIKGILWLTVPVLIIRLRRWTSKRNESLSFQPKPSPFRYFW